jgi:hypothetical protein
MVEYNPSIVPSDDDVASEEVENVSTPDALEQINKATGRNYKSLDEALGGVKETFSFVGKKTETKDVTPEPKVNPGDKVEKLEWELGKINFISMNPEAKDYVNEIGAMAKANGVSWQEAYDNSRIKSLVKEKQQAGEETPMVATGQRLRRSQNVDISADSLVGMPIAEQSKIVQKLPAWSKPLKDTEWNEANKPRNYDI